MKKQNLTRYNYWPHVTTNHTEIKWTFNIHDKKKIKNLNLKAENCECPE